MLGCGHAQTALALGPDSGSNLALDQCVQVVGVQATLGPLR
jgi:hypothetical protein